MNKTVFITGASSGIGRSAAKKFIENGWNVVATMRRPEEESELTQYSNVQLVKLDVTDCDSIKSAVNSAVERFGTIDVLVNNAGYYSIGILEAISENEIKREIDTNLCGLIWVTKEVLPIMRKNKSGVIINLSSVAGLTVVPLQSIYHATKWGVEGFTQSLKYEVEDLGIDVALIEPGVIKTDFYNRSMQFSVDNEVEEYAEISNKVGSYLIDGGNNGSSPDEVGALIYKIALAKKRKLHYVVGKSTGIVVLNKIMPNSIFRKIVKSSMMK